MTPIMVAWFVLRTGTKPSRVLYPCQKTTATLLLLKLGLVFSTESIRHVTSKKTVKIFCVFSLLLTLSYEPLEATYYYLNYSRLNITPLTLNQMQYEFPVHGVVRLHSIQATSWDFKTGFYWQYVNQTIVDQMVEEGVMALVGVSDPRAAWNIIMSNYTLGDKVGIKINGNDFWNTNENEIDTLPQVINSVIKGLKSIGVPERDIQVLEPSTGYRRLFYQYYYDIIHALYPEVILLDSDDSEFGGYRSAVVRFPYKSSHYISDLIVEVDHLIIIPVIKAITPSLGITGAIKMMQGVISSPGQLHAYLERTTPDNPDVLIYQNPNIITKVRLIVADGLFGAWTGIHFSLGFQGGSDVPKPWITFNNGAPNSLFFSIDPVAIDSVMLSYVNKEWDARGFGKLPAPQLIAGESAGLGIYEEPPFLEIDYVDLELGENPPTPIPKGILNVDSEPDKGKFVTVDGKEGYTPVSWELNAGNYTLTIDSYKFLNWSDGYTEPIRNISIVENEALNLTAFYDIRGEMVVHTYKEVNANVTIEGLEGTYIAPFSMKLKPGTYTITATFEGETLTQTVDIVSDETIVVEFYFGKQDVTMYASVGVGLGTLVTLLAIILKKRWLTLN